MVREPDPLHGPRSRSEKAALWVRATSVGITQRRAFGQVEAFCLLVGYARSGSSLFGSILNAHPEMVIAHEADIMRYVRPGVRRNQLFGILLNRDREFAEIDRQWHGFDYSVPGHAQGEFTRLRVIGDKHAGRATRWLREDPARLDRLRHVVGVPLRVVHLVRNPFDNVASMARNRDIPVSRALEVYCGLSRGVDGIRRELAPEELLDVRYEEFLQHPESVLPEVCTFLGVAVDEDYVAACATLIDFGGRRGRDTVTWSAEERDTLETLIGDLDMLKGYSYDS
jgi:Sulfotransferase family